MIGGIIFFCIANEKKSDILTTCTNLSCRGSCTLCSAQTWTGCWLNSRWGSLMRSWTWPGDAPLTPDTWSREEECSDQRDEYTLLEHLQQCFHWRKGCKVIWFNIKKFWLTNQGYNENTKKDTESIAEDVHEDDGDEGDCQVELTLPLLAASATQDLKNKKSLRQSKTMQMTGNNRNLLSIKLQLIFKKKQKGKIVFPQPHFELIIDILLTHLPRTKR